MERTRWTAPEREKVYQRVFELFDLHKMKPTVSDGAFVLNKDLIDTFIKAQQDLHLPKDRRRERPSHHETSVALPEFRKLFESKRASAATSLSKIARAFKRQPPIPVSSVIKVHTEPLVAVKPAAPSIDEVVAKAIHRALEPYHLRIKNLEDAIETLITTVDELIGMQPTLEDKESIKYMIASYREAVKLNEARGPKQKVQLKRVAVIGIHDHLVEAVRKEFEGKLKLSIYHGREKGINYKHYDHVVFMVDHANHSKYQGVKSGAYAAGVSLVHVNGGVSSLKTELNKLL